MKEKQARTLTFKPRPFVSARATLRVMASAPRKRAHTPPTGRTPQKPKPKKAGISLSAREASGRKKLTYGRPRRSLHVPANIWAEEEDKALTQFVLLSCVCDSWPSEKSTKLWEGASKFLLKHLEQVSTFS